MPLYTYKCIVCLAGRDIFKPLVELDRAEHCHKCNFGMARQLSAPRIVADYAPYECPITGKTISGRAAHRENLAEHGCRVLEPGERETAQKAHTSREAAFDSMIEKSAEEFVHALPTQKRERLIAEAEGGLDVQITRQ